MATSKTTPKKMACVTIGFNHYLLPADKAMKVVELLQDAFDCEDEYVGRDYVYHVKDQPRVEFKLVRPDQVRMPQASAPRLLR